MPICYLVPGFFGTSLHLRSSQGPTVWVDYGQLALGRLGYLRLAADGVSPGPPDGQPLFLGIPLADYFAQAAAALANSMAGTGYTFIAWGFDWRFAIPDGSPALATVIRGNVTPQDPCTILAFSLGGLYARAVWDALGRAGAQALVRRIVTVGSPHQGSYLGVQAMSNDYPTIQQLCLLAAGAALLTPLGTPISPRPITTPPGVIGVASTWPSLYDALPLLGGSDAANDPARAEMYQASNWTVPYPSQAWLTQSRTVTGPWLLSAESMPPEWVLTTIAGDGQPTATVLSQPQLLGRADAYSTSSHGDGVVGIGSALVEGSQQYVVQGAHNDLPLITASLGILARAILEDRSPPGPPPPLVRAVSQGGPQLGGPPIPSLGYGLAGGVTQGDC